VKQFYQGGTSVRADVDITKEFGCVHHKQWANLLAFAFDDVGHDGIEQGHARFHALFEHDFKGGEFLLDGFFDGV